MKMYIVLKSDIPDKLAPVIAAHASLACYRKYQNDDRMSIWIQGVFKKVVCVTDAQQFEQLKHETDYVSITESSLDHKEVCIAFCPREEFPRKFKFLEMWTPQHID